MAASSSDWPVHQLWPHSGGKQRTELDVVLFHGLQFTANDSSDAWRSTWTARGHHNVCWPQKWLPFDLGEAVCIFSLSYDAHVVTSPHDHVSEIAHNLFQTLMNPRYKWDHPIVLIGHSFGGLVLKSLVVKLKRESTIRKPTNSWSEATVQHAKVFLRNVRGVAFYAVPHAGSSNIAEYVKKLLRCNNRHGRGIMHNIQPWQRDMEQLSVDFDYIVNENNINIYAFCEGRPMKQVGILVDFSSAQRSAGNNSYMVEDADHMEVCKPPSKEHPSYGLLLQFIISCAKVARECDQPLREVHDLPQPTFGLESYVERVETLVTSEGRNAAPRYVGVCGMGGVGKTLLLQRLYGSRKIHGHFQEAKFIWLTVGQTPDILALYRRLSQELGIKPESNANAEDYKLKLHSQFRGKRVFLVLDDVWKDKAFDSLDLAKGDGSVTLLTTRNQSLLERASPHINQEHMTPLSEQDSWSLFCVHAFRRPSNVPRELKALTQSMAEECRGLPLALKVVGRAMFGKTSPELQWEPLLKKLKESRMQERTVEEGLYEHLKLGYDLLLEDDWRLKDCFLYFAAACPENCRIFFPEILCDWIGEGLVPGNGGDDPRADAFSLLDKLWRRSFIESDAEVSCENDCGGFKLHDVMRDLAFYILENDSGTPPAKQLYLSRAGQNLEEIPREWKAISKALRLSLRRNKLKTLPGSLDAPELVSLLLGGNPIRFVPESFLSNFRKLRVLDLRGGEFWNLPEELGDLKDLVYLNLSYCGNLQSLPDAVGKLHALKCLNLFSCRMLNYLPSGVVGLTSLQILYTTHCDKLAWAEHTSSGMARAESLGDVYPTIGASLEDICGLVLLTELTICGENGLAVEVPHNISGLTKLKILGLFRNLKTIPAEMPYGLIQLQKLYLGGIKGLQYLPRSFTCCGAFPALIKFELYGWSTLVEFPEVDEGALPKLRRLDFTGCRCLRTLPRSLELLTSLRELIVIDCDLTLQDSCRTYCEKSSIWRRFDIRYRSRRR